MSPVSSSGGPTCACCPIYHTVSPVSASTVSRTSPSAPGAGFGMRRGRMIVFSSVCFSLKTYYLYLDIFAQLFIIRLTNCQQGPCVGSPAEYKSHTEGAGVATRAVANM